MNTPEKIEAAGKKKEEGNDAFKAGKYAMATENLLVIRLENLLNMTPTSVKRKQNSPRALYRHAQAYIQLANLDLAGIDIKVLEIDPNTESSSVGSRSQALTVRCDMMDNCVQCIGCLLFTVYWA
ncbi:hypothetical protein IFM89_019909, partial [Coptis chinensis]